MQKYEPVMSTRPKRPRLRVSSKRSGLRLLEVCVVSRTGYGEVSSSATLEEDMSPLMRQGSQ